MAATAIGCRTGIDGYGTMTSIVVENAWIEFPYIARARTSFADLANRRPDRRGERPRHRALGHLVRAARRRPAWPDRAQRRRQIDDAAAARRRLSADARTCRFSTGRISTFFSAVPGLSLDGTGRENILTCGLYLGLNRRQINAKMDEIIDFAELGDYIDLPVRIYSAGMVTRLGSPSPRPWSRKSCCSTRGSRPGRAVRAKSRAAHVNQLIERSSILVIASHSETLLAHICNRCILLEHGRILSTDRPVPSSKLTARP